MTKKILIIGGTGFLGYHLAKHCVKKKWIVSSVSLRKPKEIRYLKEVNYIHLNIKNKIDIKNKINLDYDYVVNFGGHVNHKEKLKTYESHFVGCKNLIDYFINSKNLKLFLQIGSCVEYGYLNSPQSEKKKIRIDKLKSTYGSAKLKASNYLLNKFKKKNFRGSIFRPYLVYGPKQDFNRLIPIVIKSCIENKNFDCTSGEQLRDFLYIDDFIMGVIKCLKNEDSSGKIFNIGSSKPIEVKYVIGYISSLINKGKPNYGKLKMRNDEIKNLYPDTKTIKKILKWSPRVKFTIGIKRTIKYYKKTL